MTATQELSIVTELIKEVESYLPDMKGFLLLLSEDGTGHNGKNVKELHRMTHTIKGAAAMVQLDELSKSAALMEDVLDDILAGKQGWNSRLIAVMRDSLDDIGAYCSALQKGEDNGAALHQKIGDAFETVNDVLTSRSTIAAVSGPDENLFDLFPDDETDESTDDFLQQLSDEHKNMLSGDELQVLPGSVDSDSEDTEKEIFPDPCTNESGEDFQEVATQAPNVPDQSGAEIDPELQACFNEEVSDHLEDLGSQLNILSSSITGLTAITEDYRDILHSIRRSVHTMKGAAAVVGIDPVAAWGHDFEDFLDWLHDNSETLSPDIVSVMIDGSDLLEKIAAQPGVEVDSETGIMQRRFQEIIASSSGRKKTGRDSKAPDIHPAPNDIDSGDIPRDAVLGEAVDMPSVAEQVVPFRIPASKNKRKQVRDKTLRVGSSKIAGLMRLGGDMAINLSSFENAAFSMHSTLAELEMTLQRLKNIAAILENDYEPSAISHVRAMPGVGRNDGGMTAEFDSLEMDRYSDLHILIGSLNEAVVDFISIREQSLTAHNSWRLAIDRQRRIVREVQDAVQSIQMTPFSTLANRLYKTVRESARVTGKNVRLFIEGSSIEMDTHIWDVLADALMHMLRNCVDHGVEPADERIRAGKPEEATIRITCSRRGSRCVLHLSDDGRGLNYEAIRNRAVTLFPEIGVERMENKELAALIFKQGFSTRAKVTSLSGRGVGMDVVRNALEQLDGFIEVTSTPGQGADFVLSTPIVVAQLPALLVTIGRQQFAVPMRDISKVLRLSDEEMTGDTFELDNASLPLLRPAELLALQCSDDSAEGNDVRGTTLALVVETGGTCGVMIVDAVIGQKNVVFKSLGSHLQNISCIAGATILGDGSLVPILQTEDVFTLVAAKDRSTNRPQPVRSDEEKTLEVLIVDDSISIRKVLSNCISAQGWHSTSAHDGVNAMEKIRDRKPDLMILDIEMPRMNGFDVLHTLQSQSAYRDIPVLMLTSRSAGKYRDKAAQLGARGFVTKPFRDDELVALINDLIGENIVRGHRNS